MVGGLRITVGAAPTFESRQVCLRIPLRPSRALRESPTSPILILILISHSHSQILSILFIHVPFPILPITPSLHHSNTPSFPSPCALGRLPILFILCNLSCRSPWAKRDPCSIPNSPHHSITPSLQYSIIPFPLRPWAPSHPVHPVQLVLP